MPLKEPLERYRHEVDALKERYLYRTRLTLDGPQSGCNRIGGRGFLSFCSNDYLGLANDPRLIEALQRGAKQFGVGAGASHLVNGHRTVHATLEEELADFVGAERALTFSTGYMANLAVAQVFAGRGDLVVEDKLNHASLIDAGLLTRAKLRRYAHADADHARRILSSSKQKYSLLLSDAVFSMDGDTAPVEALIAAANEHRALALFDDAHGFGVLGREGRGTLDQFGARPKDRVLMMGTLGKAMGTFGAFVAGDEVLIDMLLQTARPYIYTTAAPPALAEATRKAIEIARQEDWRREWLRTLIQRFRSGAQQLGLPMLDSNTPIQPVLIGESRDALALSAALEDSGILVVAIRPPTVPKGTARLRVTLSAAHTETDVDQLLDALDAARHIAVVRG